MKLAVLGLAVAGLLLAGTKARALSSLARVTPQNIKGSTFQLFSNAGQNHTVEFVIQRNVRNIEVPGKRAFLSDSETDARSLGTPIKLEESGNILTFRFSVPEAKVATSEFNLLGHGDAAGEGVTYRFQLGDFWKPRKN